MAGLPAGAGASASPAARSPSSAEAARAITNGLASGIPAIPSATNALATPNKRVLPNRVGPRAQPKPFQAVLESSEKAFAWDEVDKTYRAKPGELTANFTFNLTNISPKEATITSVASSCGCTVAKLPPMPWVIPSGTSGSFDVTTDLRGKSGVFAKTITVGSSAGTRILHVTSIIPPNSAASAADRERNTKMAGADRQAVFKNDCATCHVQPARGKMGKELYAAACGICHDAEHRATMVPNLQALNKPVDAAYWAAWIAHGKTNSLMPAFAIAEGGPLDAKEIESLVEYLDARSKTPNQPGKASVGTGQRALPH